MKIISDHTHIKHLFDGNEQKTCIINIRKMYVYYCQSANYVADSCCLCICIFHRLSLSPLKTYFHYNCVDAKRSERVRKYLLEILRRKQSANGKQYTQTHIPMQLVDEPRIIQNYYTMFVCADAYQTAHFIRLCIRRNVFFDVSKIICVLNQTDIDTHLLRNLLQAHTQYRLYDAIRNFEGFLHARPL